MTKVTISPSSEKPAPQTLSADRDAARAELEALGIPSDGVADLDYDHIADAGVTDTDVAAAGFNAPQPLSSPAQGRISGVGRAKKPEGGLAHKAPKPDWLRVRAPQSKNYEKLLDRVKQSGVVTVCEEAACPNIGDCWASGHLTTMILGDTCTRGCAFCNIKTGKPNPVNPNEPYELGRMAKDLQLKHFVITSVDRDDLPDGGAQHWADCIEAVRAASPSTSIEILTPDFRRVEHGIDTVINARPDVFNHNLETIPRLYRTVRPGARYFGSLRLLQHVKERSKAEGLNIYTKSGLMVGMGESRDEVLQVMDDMRSAGVDFLTIGQYLRPSPKHYPLMAYITPEQFEDYERQAKLKGFKMVASGALVRSSFHADVFFEELKKAG